MVGGPEGKPIRGRPLGKMWPGLSVKLILSLFVIELRTSSSADDTLEFQKTRKFIYLLFIHTSSAMSDILPDTHLLGVRHSDIISVRQPDTVLYKSHLLTLLYLLTEKSLSGYKSDTSLH